MSLQPVTNQSAAGTLIIEVQGKRRLGRLIAHVSLGGMAEYAEVRWSGARCKRVIHYSKIVVAPLPASA